MAAATTQVKILVPGHQSMVALLGQQDAFLKLIEAAFSSDILVRGNEITITGTRSRSRAARAVVRRAAGAPREGAPTLRFLGRPDDRADQGRRRRGGGRRRRDRHDEAERGARRHAPHRARHVGRTEDRRAEAVRRRDAELDRHLRDRTGGHRQDLSRRRHRGASPPRSSGVEVDPHAPGGRGGGAARIPAGDPLREDRSVHASALRRPVRDDRRREPLAVDGERHGGGGAPRVHARANAERRVHHPRRGAEHDPRADEDVPHEDRIRVEGRRERG